MDVQDKTQEIDPKVHDAIKVVISKDPSDLTVADRAFLRARQSYLGRNARSKFATALAETPEEKAETPEEEVKEVDNSKHPADVATQANTQASSDEDDVE